MKELGVIAFFILFVAGFHFIFGPTATFWLLVVVFLGQVIYNWQILTEGIRRLGF